LAELDLGGLALFQGNVGLGSPRTSPMMIIASSILMDVVLGSPRTSPMMIIASSILMDVLGGKIGSVGTCGNLKKPKEG
jgi:hypothetical protein